MRRGIGVGYVQETTSVKEQMKDLGSRITAERVTDVMDQLEELEKQLRTLAKRYEKAIQEDPVVRARFRRLAESLGLDLLSSQKNIFSGVLGLGDFYYRLAGKVVECCMAERKFFGSYVPLDRVLEQVKKPLSSILLSKPQGGKGKEESEWSKKKEVTEEINISQEDVLTALKKLRCFGSGYDVVTLGGIFYIRTSPDGTEGKDSTHVINFLLQRQEEQREEEEKRARRQKVSERGRGEGSSSGSSSLLSTTVDHSRMGAAYVLGTSTYDSTRIPVTEFLRLRSVPFSLFEIVEALNWEEHRALAVVSRLVQDGTLWVDYPYATSPEETDPSKGNTVKAKQKKVPLQAVEKKSKAIPRSVPTASAVDGGAVYWFLPTS